MAREIQAAVGRPSVDRGRLFKRLTIGVIVAVLVGEGLLRWVVGLGDPPLATLDPVTEYELVASADYRRWGNRISVNAAGMRAPEVEPFAADQDRRVLLIGDSVVYGGHHIDQSETIAAQLTMGLAGEARLAGCNTVVLPMAVSSWGPVNQAAFLQRDGDYGAQVAAIVISAHDLYDVPDGRPESVPYRLTPSLTAIGDATRIVWRRFVDRPDPVPVTASDQERSEASLLALDQMVDQLRAGGVEPVLVYYPTANEVAGEDRDERRAFTDWAATRQVDVLDLAEAGLDADGYRDPLHPNAVGALRMADRLQESIGPRLEPCDTQ